MRTAEPEEQEMGESPGLELKERAVDLGKSMDRHAPGNPIPRVISGPEQESRPKGRWTNEGAGRATKQYYPQHPQIEKAALGPLFLFPGIVGSFQIN